MPRDAGDQYNPCQHIPGASARPGDLFFALDGMRTHHVGILTPAGRMLRPPETGAASVGEPLTPARSRTLVGAGRPPGPPSVTGSIR